VTMTLLLCGMASAGWASDCTGRLNRKSTSQNTSYFSAGQSSTNPFATTYFSISLLRTGHPEGRDSIASPTADARDPRDQRVQKNGAAGFCAASWEQSLLSDQKTIWTSPWHLHAGDRNWLLPVGLGTAGLLASDKDIMRHFRSTPIAHSSGFSNYGLGAMVASAAGLYLRGAMSNDMHSREAGFLAGEAAVDGVIVAETLKFAFERPRPNAANSGDFGRGGASFPSEHAFAAWSIASVIANEYPGPMTKLLAYGAASGIALARVGAREHFPSDVVVGSALGYLIGKFVYRAHHDPELPGASVHDPEKDLDKDTAERVPRRPRPPSEIGSPSVPLDSWVYAAIDRLAALGYASSAYADLRPWTRMECARIVAAAGDDLGSDNLGVEMRSAVPSIGDRHPPEAFEIYAELKAEFANDLERLNDSGSSEVGIESVYTRYLGIAGTPLDDGYHFGQTLINDFGRLYGDGSNLVTGGSASGEAGPFAFYVRGEFQHAAPLPAYSAAVQQLIGALDVTPPQDPIHTTVIDQFHLLDAYIAWNFKTVQISAGRQSLWWGPGAGGPPNLSDNAQPIDMLRLTNPSPWTLPSFLHWLGPIRFDSFVGLMAGHHYPPTPAIDGQKISFKPTPNLEFGFSRTIVFRPITTRMFLRGFFSFGDNQTTVPGSEADVGDRRSGFDFSYRIPGLRRWLVLYNDGMTDDETSPLGYPQMSLMNPGVYLPQIPGIRKLDFRAEMMWSDPPALSNRGGQYFYYNGAYHDSYTNDGHLLGSWVGREGHGVQLWSTYWLSPRNSIQAGYRKAHVDRDFIPQGGNIQDVFVRANFRLRPEMEMTTFLQYESWDFPVLSPLAGPNTVASVEFTYHPKWSKALHF
jgi:membrane-associated phospholipid phosphatase